MNNALTSIIQKSLEFLHNNPLSLSKDTDYYLDLFKKISSSLQEQALVIAIIGVTSSGKSAFMNALLGEKLLPEGSIPTSGILVKCQHSENRKLVVRFTNRKIKEYKNDQITTDEVRSFAEEKQNEANKKGVYDLLYFSPKIQLSEKFILVDTPGLNAYGCPGHEELTIRNLLPIAHIVILLTSIRDPFKKSTLDILLEALERNLGKDQRIFFVQTCKDIARRSTEKGRTIESKEENLRKHKKRLYNSIANNTNLQNVRIIQVSSSIAQEANKEALSSNREELWRNSGFQEINEMLNSYSPQINKILSLSNAQNSFNIVKSIIDIFNKSCNICENGIENISKNRESLKSEMMNLQNRINDIKQNISNFERVMKSKSNKRKSRIINFLKNGLGKNSETEIRKTGEEICNNLSNTWRILWQDLHSKKQEIQACLDDLQIPKFNTPSNKAEELKRPFPKLTKGKKKIKSEKPGFIAHIKRFFGRESGWNTKTMTFLKKSEYKKNVIEYIDSDFKLMHSKIGEWRKSLNSTSIDPLEAALKRKLNLHDIILQKYKKGELDLRELQKQLTFWENIKKEIQSFIKSNSSRIELSKPWHTANRPQTEKPMKDLLRKKIWNAISSTREAKIANTFINTAGKISGPMPKILLIGPKSIGKTKYLKFLLHDAEASPKLFPSPTTEITHYLSKTNSNTFPKNIHHKINILNKKILNLSSIIDAPGDENLPSNLDYDLLFSSVDVIALFFGLQTIGSSVNDFYKAPYFESLKLFRSKLLYVGVGAREFIARLEQIYFDCYIYFAQKTELGESPMIIFDDYDNRYNIIFNLMKNSVTEENAWEEAFFEGGGYFDDLITRKSLLNAYHKMMEEVFSEK